MVKKLQNFVNGQYVDVATSSWRNVYNPALGEVIAQVPDTPIEEARAAIKIAKTAFEGWSKVTPAKRARILFRFRDLLEKNHDELGRIAALEHGKTLDDAKAEVARGIEITEFACGAPHLLKGEMSYNLGTAVDGHNLRQPLGVVAGIAPFNFPAMIPLWMAPIAIVCGNTFILKPSGEVPSLALRLGALWKEAGLPDGVFNVVNGGREIVTEITENTDIEAISFVGSTTVAKIVYTKGAEAGKRVQALGAAKNHALVMADADMEFTANNIMGAAFGSAGERCMALPIVVCIGDDTADKLIELLLPKIKALKIGQFDEAGVEMGPLISEAHKKKVEEYIRIGVEEDKATLLVDGRDIKRAGLENGFFVGPTLFDNVKPGMITHNEEIFGPVLGIMRAKSFDEAIGWINEHEFGNGSVIFTASGSAARIFTETVKAGMVGVNVPIPAPSALFSFGGWKASLFGDHHMYGPEGIRFFTRLKTVTTRWPEGSMDGENSFIMPTT